MRILGLNITRGSRPAPVQLPPGFNDLIQKVEQLDGMQARVDEHEDALKLISGQETGSNATVEGAIKTKRRPPRRDLPQEGPKGRVFSNRTTNVELTPIYDLNEAIKLQDVESYVRISYDRHVEVIMKNGYRLKGKNPETIRYIAERIQHIEYISEQPFSDMLREVARNAVSCSNAWMVFSRDRNRSAGNPIKMFGKRLMPISSISVPDPGTVRVKQNASGRPYQWIQRGEKDGGTKRTWQYQDVIHIPIAKKSGYIFGTPFIVPVLEDIRALRKLEMLSEHVAHKFAFPLMQWKVGTDKLPADMYVNPQTGEGIPEVDIANNYAESMAQEGYVVTSHRHEIVMIGPEGERLDLKPFIEHYENRVISGLRLSEVDLGRGNTANRGTAQVMSQVMIDSCTEIQDVIASYVTMKLLNALLLEGGYRLTDENKVLLAFPPIDAEAQRAKEAHGLNLYVQGAITRPEMRMDYMDRDQIEAGEEEETYLWRHLKVLLDWETEAKIKIANAKPAPTAGGGGAKGSGSGSGTGKSGGAKQKKASGRSGSGATSQNQHGKAATRPKLAKNDALNEAFANCARALISGIHEGEAKAKDIDLRPTVAQGVRNVGNECADLLRAEYSLAYHGAAARLVQAGHTLSPAQNLSNLDHFLMGFRRKDLQQLSRGLSIAAGISSRDGLLEGGKTALTVMPAFETAKTLLATKLDRAIDGVRLLAQLDAHASAGVNEVKLLDTGGAPWNLNLSDTSQVLEVTTNPVLLSTDLPEILS